jgi:RNA polymerase sigma-70 factor (ECF subfamily)
MKYTTEDVWKIFCCKLQPYIRKWVTDPELAKDIEQDVFLKIHEKIDTLKDNTKVHSWVLQITKNTILDNFRKQKEKFQHIEKLELEDFQQGEIFNDTKERNLKEEISSGMKTLIESLPDKYSQALLMVEYQGISQVDLAKKLKLSPSAAKSRVQRGRLMVKDRLLQCCHYEFDKYGNVVGVQPDSCLSCSH